MITVLQFEYDCLENHGLYTVFLYYLITNMRYLIVMVQRVILTERDSCGKNRSHKTC